MVISSCYIAPLFSLLLITVSHAADEAGPLVFTREFSEEGPVFHVTRKAENLDVFAQLLLVPPSTCYMDEDLEHEEALNGLFYAVACMHADSMVNHKFNQMPLHFTQEDIEGGNFMASLGAILTSDPAVGDGAKVYGKVLNLLLKMKGKKIDTSKLINQAYLKGLRVTSGDINFLWKAKYEKSTRDDDRMRKGILLATRECHFQVEESIATILECSYSPETAKERVIILLRELGGVSIHGGYALVDIEGVRKELDLHAQLSCKKPL